MFACNGILFNHESPTRGETFVTRKITQAVARIHVGQQKLLFLGNLYAKRDWGHARDYVEAQWLMLQQEKPEDFVIATGVQYSVKEFVECAFAEAGIAIVWKGEGIDEVGIAQSSNPLHSGIDGQTVVCIDPRYFRPTEVDSLIGDASKAKRVLGWVPRISFAELVSEMVREDIKWIQQQTSQRERIEARA